MFIAKGCQAVSVCRYVQSQSKSRLTAEGVTSPSAFFEVESKRHDCQATAYERQQRYPGRNDCTGTPLLALAGLVLMPSREELASGSYPTWCQALSPAGGNWVRPQASSRIHLRQISANPFWMTCIQVQFYGRAFQDGVCIVSCTYHDIMNAPLSRLGHAYDGCDCAAAAG